MFKSRFSSALISVVITALFLTSVIFSPRTIAQTRPVIIAPGFEFNIFARPENVPEFALSAFSGPVAMAFDSRGRLFVSTYSGKIFILLDNDEDGVLDEVKTFAAGVSLPLGLAFRSNGDLYATSNLFPRGVGQIVRLRDANGDDVADEKTVIVDNLPSQGDHQTNRLKFGPDGLLYFSQGSATDAGQPKPGFPPEQPFNGTIMRVDVDNPSSLQVYATGLRNAFGIAFHPDNGQLFATDGGSGEFTGLPDDPSPLEEVNWIVQGGYYGFPGCEGVIDPAKPECAGARSAITHFRQHLTPTSIAFYTGPQAGADRNQMLVTLYKRYYGEGGDLRRFTLSGNSSAGFTAAEVFPRFAEFGIIDPFDGPIDTAIDPISGDIYVARFDPVNHADPNEHHHFIYRIHRAGSDLLPFIGPARPSAVRAGSNGLTISITGRHLKPGAVVVNVTDNIALATRQGANRFELLVDLPASMLMTTRAITLEARNPDGLASNQQPFTVTMGDPEPPPPDMKSPVLTRLYVYKKKKSKIVDPVIAGSAAKKLRLVVEGTDFDQNAQLLVNNTAIEIISATGTELIGRMTNEMISTPRDLTVQVRNSNGKVSNTLTLRVTQ